MCALACKLGHILLYEGGKIREKGGKGERGERGEKKEGRGGEKERRGIFFFFNGGL